MSLNRKPLRRILLLAALALSLIAVIVIAPTPTPAAASTSSWGSGTLTDAELWNLIGQMTLAEKSLMIRGSSDTTCATANISPSVQGCQGQAGTCLLYTSCV